VAQAAATPFLHVVGFPMTRCLVVPVMLSLFLFADGQRQSVLLRGYGEMRSKLSDENLQTAFDANTTLSPVEQTVDSLLRSWRDAYVNKSKARGTFAPSHFFYTWNFTEVRNDRVFKFIDSMPKGANLHIHTGSTGSTDWLLTEGINMAGCYVFWSDDDRSRCINPVGGRVTKLPDSSRGCDATTQGQPLLRGALAFYRAGAEPPGFVSCRAAASQAGFRESLRRLLTANKSLAALDSNHSWKVFNDIFSRLGPAMAYRPLFMNYMMNTFDVHLSNGITHLEVRALCGTQGVGHMYDLQEPARLYVGSDIVASYREALEAFRGSSPGRAHFSMKLILSTVRTLSPRVVEDDLRLAIALRRESPDLVVGFDMVAEEDPNHRTLDYVGPILRARAAAQQAGVDLPLYLHDGESDDRHNTNVMDAVLLGCPRLGHGFNSAFFPAVVKELRAKGIALEISPLSNQVLRYVDNLEVHPAVGLALKGVQMVIANDDPGIYDYEGLTWDLWAVTMAWRLDLRALKTLLRNSLQFSALRGAEKAEALQRWDRDWDQYIQQHVTLYT